MTHVGLGQAEEVASLGPPDTRIWMSTTSTVIDTTHATWSALARRQLSDSGKEGRPGPERRCLPSRGMVEGAPLCDLTWRLDNVDKCGRGTKSKSTGSDAQSRVRPGLPCRNSCDDRTAAARQMAPPTWHLGRVSRTYALRTPASFFAHSPSRKGSRSFGFALTIAW